MSAACPILKESSREDKKHQLEFNKTNRGKKV